MNSEYNLQFEKLCKELGLGVLTGEPQQVFGGHLHRMYYVNTSSGQYAVKALNPPVMQRPIAKKNTVNSELIAQIASGYIPAAPAKRFDGIPEIDGQLYLVYDWIDGKSIFDDEIKIFHCEEMGRILAVIHGIDFSSLNLTDDYSGDEKFIDWNFYLKRAKEEQARWYELIAKNIDNLYRWNNSLIEASRKMAAHTVISHCDLEPKNVMWCDNRRVPDPTDKGKTDKELAHKSCQEHAGFNRQVPIIIDWEAAGFIHPMHDLIETAIYWSSEHGEIREDKFKAFVSGYKSIAKNVSADWDIVLGKGFGSKLGWLEYSLNRSLGSECADEVEKSMGTEHVFGTIQQLRAYEGIKDRIKSWMINIVSI